MYIEILLKNFFCDHLLVLRVLRIILRVYVLRDLVPIEIMIDDYFRTMVNLILKETRRE